MKRLAIIKTVRSDPITQLLIKPIVFLLIVGLVGCTTTRWRVFEPKSQAPIRHVRVTFKSGSQFEAHDAIVSRETISGTTKDGKTFAVSMDEVRTLELYMGSDINVGAMVGAYMFVSIVVLIILSNICILCDLDLPQ